MCGRWSCSGLWHARGARGGMVNGVVLAHGYGRDVPCIIKKFGKPGTVLPRYAIGPPCASLYSLSVPLVPRAFNGYSSC